MFNFKFSKKIPILCLLLLITFVLTSRLLIDKREAFWGNSMLGFSDAPSKKLKPVPEFGVGDNYSYQTQPSRSKEYVDPGPDKSTLTTSQYYINSEVKIWSPELIQEFLQFQAIQNPDVIFDMDLVQQQATEEEVQQLLENGVWPWSDRCKKIYEDVISRSPFTKKSPMKGIKVDQTIYNERVMLQMLGLNEPEGKFLMFGHEVPDEKKVKEYINSGKGTYGINSGLIDKGVYMNKLVCDDGKMKLKSFQGYNKGITSAPIYQTQEVSNDVIPALYNGFQFIEEPCNPCKALDFPYDTSCPFSIKPDKKVSPAWETIWGLPETPIPDLPKNFPFWEN